jgi:hypothetical protein
MKQLQAVDIRSRVLDEVDTQHLSLLELSLLRAVVPAQIYHARYYSCLTLTTVIARISPHAHSGVSIIR